MRKVFKKPIIECPEPGCGRWFKNRSGFTKHFNTFHRLVRSVDIENGDLVQVYSEESEASLSGAATSFSCSNNDDESEGPMDTGDDSTADVHMHDGYDLYDEQNKADPEIPLVPGNDALPIYDSDLHQPERFQVEHGDNDDHNMDSSTEHSTRCRKRETHPVMSGRHCNT